MPAKALQTKHNPSKPSHDPNAPAASVRIDYNPRPAQLEVHNSKALYRVIVAHRRFGKTTLAINELIRSAILVPGRYWYVAPSYRQAKTIALAMVLRYLPPELIAKKNETDLTIQLFNGSEIALKGAENKDSLRGVGLKGVVLDEYAQMDRDTWEAIIGPTLLDNPAEPGWAIFIGTPKGRNHFFQVFSNGKTGKKKWASFQFSATTTGIFDPEELTRLREELTEDTYREEYMAEFLDGEGTVFRGVRYIVEPKTSCYAPPRSDRGYQMGVDLARLRDWTVVTIVDSHTSKVVHWERFNKLDWEFQKLRVANLADTYNHARIVVDATGVGDPIAIDLERMGLQVLAYKITSSEPKQRLIDNLKLRIEQKQVTIPDEGQLLKELEAYEFHVTDSGRTLYEAPNGENDDCVMSLALALWDLQPPSFLRKEDIFPEYCDDF